MEGRQGFLESENEIDSQPMIANAKMEITSSNLQRIIA
jgi:hypothetical protein